MEWETLDAATHLVDELDGSRVVEVRGESARERAGCRPLKVE